MERRFAKELFAYINLKKFDKIWFDFRIASYVFLKFRNLNILNKHLTYYRQLDNSASKEYKTFSKNWWIRRKQAHEFIFYLEKKLNLPHKLTIDKIITSIINFFI